MRVIKKIISTVNNAQVRLFTPLTVKQIRPFIEEGERVLDIGSGLGYQAKQIQKQSKAEVTGIDVIDYRDSEIPFSVFDGRHIPFPDDFFDVSYIAYVLHHAKEPIQLLQDAIRVTKKRIIIIEDTPRNFFDWTLDAYHGWSFNKFYKLTNPSFFRSKEQWEEIFNTLGVHTYRSKRLSRFSREPYFPISRTRFVMYL